MQARLIPTLFAAAILIAVAPRASAETIKLDYDHSTGSAAVPFQVTINGNTSSMSVTPGPYYWHATSGTTPPVGFPTAIATFCIEVNQGLSDGTTYTINSNLAAMPTIGNTVKANQIEELWGRYYDTNWANTSFTGSLQASAFQLALWELVYDGPGSLNITGGNFRSTSGSASNPGTATGLAASWLGSLSPTGSNAAAFNNRFNGYDLVGLTNGSKQDQITMISLPPPTVQNPVPAPPGLVLAGLGFLGLLGRARYLRRTA